MLSRENPGPSLSRIPGTHGTRPGERLGSSCRAGLLSRNRDGLPDHRCGTSQVAYVLWLCPNLRHSKHATEVRRSSNGDTTTALPPNDTLFDLSSFPASSVATLTATDAYWPLGLGPPSHLIIRSTELYP